MDNVMFSGLVDLVEKHPDKKKLPHSFTTYVDSTLETEYEDCVDRLISPAIVYGPYRSKVSIGAKALWDTGSRSSCISRKLAKELELPETGRKTVLTPTGSIEVPTHRVDLVLWDELSFSDLEVTEYPLERHDCDILIGMDIISRGKLTIDSTSGKTKISFTV